MNYCSYLSRTFSRLYAMAEIIGNTAETRWRASTPRMTSALVTPPLQGIHWMSPPYAGTSCILSGPLKRQSQCPRLVFFHYTACLTHAVRFQACSQLRWQKWHIESIPIFPVYNLKTLQTHNVKFPPNLRLQCGCTKTGIIIYFFMSVYDNIFSELCLILHKSANIALHMISHNI